MAKDRADPLIAVVVAVHNNLKDTEVFLESMENLTYRNTKTIIVDDGSKDGTGEMITERFPEVILLKGDGDLWWSRSANRGVEKALEIGADFVFFGDNDSTLDQKCISELLETARRYPNSIITPKVYFHDNPKMIQSCGWYVNWFEGGFMAFGVGEVDDGQYDKRREVTAANTWFMGTDIFGDIGFLDHKRFPQFHSDVDFTYRAHINGYRIIFEPKAKMWHKLNGTVSRDVGRFGVFDTFKFLLTNLKAETNYKERVNLYRKHCPPYFWPLVFSRYAAEIVVKSLKRKTFYKS